MSFPFWLFVSAVVVLVAFSAAYWYWPIRQFLIWCYGGLEWLFFKVSEPVVYLAERLDAFIIWTSRPWGTRAANSYTRWTMFIGWSGLIYAVIAFSPVAWVQLLAVLWGVWGVLAINRAWAANEKRRSKIAKKIDPDAKLPATPHDEAAAPDPQPVAAFGVIRTGDGGYTPAPPRARAEAATTTRMLLLLRALPDLRSQALLAGLQCAFLFPFLFMTAHETFGLFENRQHVSFGDCGQFIADKAYLNDLINLIGLESWHSNVVLIPGNEWILRAIKSLVYYLIFMAIVRWFHIRDDVREGIMGVRQDPDMAVLLGRRAVSRLQYLLDEDDVAAAEKVHALLALGKLRELRALRTLRKFSHARDPMLRSAAAIALGDLASPLVPPGKPGEHHHARPLRRAAFAANGKACAVLRRRLLKDRHAGVREAAAIALGRVDHPEAPKVLLARLREVQTQSWTGVHETEREVIKHIAESLGDRLRPDWKGTTPDAATRAGHVEVAVELILAEKLPPERNLLRHRYLRVRNRAITALGALGNAKALPQMLKLLGQNENPKLLSTWATAIGNLAPALSETEAREAAETLRDLAVRQDNGTVRVAAVRAMGKLAASRPAIVEGGITKSLVEVLVGTLKEDDKAVSDAIAEVLRDGFKAETQVEAAREAWDWQRVWDRVEVVRGKGDTAARVAAAKAIPELNDHVSLDKLQKVLADAPDLPAELRAEIEAAVERLEKAIREGESRVWGDE